MSKIKKIMEVLKMEFRKILLTVVIIIVIIIMGSMVYEVFLTDKFCESKGYDWYHTNTEEGYIACCNSVMEDHIVTYGKVCEAFKFNSFWFS